MFDHFTTGEDDHLLFLTRMSSLGSRGSYSGLLCKWGPPKPLQHPVCLAVLAAESADRAGARQAGFC